MEPVPQKGATDAEQQEAFWESKEAILKYVEDLDKKLRDAHLELEVERDRSARAKKKIRQLLHKLGERDKVIAQLRTALDAMQVAAGLTANAKARLAEHADVADVGLQKSTSRSRLEPVHDTMVRSASGQLGSRHPLASSAGVAVGGATSSGSKAGQRRPSGHSGLQQQLAAGARRSTGLSSRDLAIRERAEIVLQLEGHLSQMRMNLEEGEKEVSELEDRKRHKEVEWSRSPVGKRSESAQLHWHAIGVIGQQITEKRRFIADLAHKAQELELQVAQQRQLIDELSAGRTAGDEVQGEAVRSEDEAENAASSDGAGEDRLNSQAGAEALATFLSAAGSTAEVVKKSPALYQAFEAVPPALSMTALEDCVNADERAQSISLLTAWAAVSVREMHINDLPLDATDAEAWESTLDTCGAQLERLEVSRCIGTEAVWRRFFAAAMTQPMCRLNLGYNGFGPQGLEALLEAAVAWKASLEFLGLEMNGLGDAGCKLITTALGQGLLPGLQTLELGWNELSSESAEMLTALLKPSATTSSIDGEAAGVCDTGGVPWLQRLGLSGNSFGSAGAKVLALGALSQPARALDLDLAMNHVGSEPLVALAEWLESHAERISGDDDAAGPSIAVSIGLEWNSIDDISVVERLASAVEAAKVRRVGPTGLASMPLFRLGNNEITGLDPALMHQESGGLIAC